jgi:hypothetical protein
VSVLVGLEGDVVKTLQSIKKGIAMLDERRAQLDSDGAGPAVAGDDRDDADDGAWADEDEAQPARR